MGNDVQLITYPDRLAGSINGLTELLRGKLEGLFGGVHLLPFFTPIDGADAGFDPADHRVVDPSVGEWDAVARLATAADVCADLIVNHVSDASPWFVDYAEQGAGSAFDGMFHTLDSVFPDGAAEADLLAVYRPRPGLPLSPKLVAGRTRLMWTTFTEHQIDVDVEHPATWQYLVEVLDLLAAHGVSCVRLDAAGYAVNTAGTNCFLTEHTYAFIDRLTEHARRRGLRVLAEIHAHHQRQAEIAARVDLVYDFALPPLTLHAVHSGDVAPLLHWLDVRPTNAVTVLDTHDGIGVIDVGADPLDPDRPGLLTPAQIDTLVESIHVASGGVSRQATGQAASNVDLYQVNCSWYDALGRDDARMCLTRLIQMFAPGAPQVYYVGLLAGGNDTAPLARTSVGRDVNRHRFTPAEVEAALRRPVVAAVTTMIRLRGRHPAFDGQFEALPGEADDSLLLRWSNGPHRAWLQTTPGQGIFTVGWSTPDGERTAATVAELASFAPPAHRPDPADIQARHGITARGR
jgi:sucrose phosphorylase